MKFGICTSFENAPMARDAGFDYIEGNVAGLLKPSEPQSVFEDIAAKALQSVLPIESMNGFNLAPEIKYTGPDADLDRIVKLATTAFERARQLHICVIVFGAGGARRVPDGWLHSTATQQLVEMLKLIGPIAQDNNITIAIEPLRKAECNIVTSVQEAASIARTVNNPAVRVLVDGFHWGEDDGSEAEIVGNADILRHVHIATLPNRLAPGAEEYDFSRFAHALKAARYNGRISIEAKKMETLDQMLKAHEILSANFK